MALLLKIPKVHDFTGIHGLHTVLLTIQSHQKGAILVLLLVKNCSARTRL